MLKPAQYWEVGAIQKNHDQRDERARHEGAVEEAAFAARHEDMCPTVARLRSADCDLTAIGYPADRIPPTTPVHSRCLHQADGQTHRKALPARTNGAGGFRFSYRHPLGFAIDQRRSVPLRKSTRVVRETDPRSPRR